MKFPVGTLLVYLAVLGSVSYILKQQIDSRVEAEVLATKEKTRADNAEEERQRVQSKLMAERARHAMIEANLQAQLDRTEEVNPQGVKIRTDTLIFLGCDEAKDVAPDGTLRDD